MTNLISGLAPLLLLFPMAATASNIEDTVGSVEVCPGVLRVQIMEGTNIYEFYESTDQWKAPGPEELICEKYFEMAQ